MANLKGFIKTSNGDIILPISRGELIFDAAGNIALHSPVFKAEAGVRYTQEEISNAVVGDDAYGKTVKMYKTGSGKYGLMTPEDLLDLHEALVRIDRIEQETGVGGEDIGESLKQTLLDLIEKVGYYKGEVTGTDSEGNPITQASDTGIYKYINDKIINHLAQSDALKFKGTLGVGGNVQDLPTTGINNGDTYKVITTSRYDGKFAKPGDLFIALYTPGDNGGTYTWDLVPSGNEQETFIKVTQYLGTEPIDKVLSGTVEIIGANGVTVQYIETAEGKGQVVIAGQGQSISLDITALKQRVQDLEDTVNGKPASGTPGTEDYQPPVQGLVQKTNQIKSKIDNAVTTWEEVVEREVDEEGQTTGNLVHGDDLVKSSAVYEVTVKLAQHIATADTKYLQAETIALGTPLTTAQKAYVAGAILN